MNTNFITIDSYIKSQPKNIQALLKQIRATIKKSAPKAEEAISYGIPTFKLNGNLVHFAGYKTHIGFYPGAGGIKEFGKEISKFKWSKGTVQFPINKPLPLDLVTKITKFRVKQNLAKTKKVEDATISSYNNSQSSAIKKICVFLNKELSKGLKNSDSKVWHGSPVWFLQGNPVVSYSVRKDERVSLMFFSGQSFDESALKKEGSFKAAEIFYKDVKEIKLPDLKRWLKKAQAIQWDYKNIIKNKGVLKKITKQKTAN